MITLKRRIIEAAYKAVDELIEVAEEKVIQKRINDDGEAYELAADRLKNAAAAKKIAIFDAFEILNKAEAEKAALDDMERGQGTPNTNEGFAERRSKRK